MANFYNEYILKKAEEYGFGEPTKSNWINYMMNDVLRGENLLNVIITLTTQNIHFKKVVL